MGMKEFFRCGKNERGAAMLEALLAMFVLLLVLCGFLHLIYFYIAQYFTEYAAIRGARSYVVGFSDYLSNREAKINAIGASGKLVIPEKNNPVDEDGNEIKQTYNSSREKTLILRFMTGYTYIEYKNWNGYQEKNYVEDERGGYKNKYENREQPQTFFHTRVKDADSNKFIYTASFENYVFFEEITRFLFFGKNINPTASVELVDYSKVYLE